MRARFRISSYVHLTLAVALLGAPAVVLASDADADGLDDAWEMDHFGSISVSDGAADPDDDTVPNALEFEAGLDPNAATSVNSRPDWHGLPGYLRYERWNGVDGIALADFYAADASGQQAHVRGFASVAETESNAGDNFAVRLRGTLRAPVAGNYRFYIAGDNQAELWLGTPGSAFATASKFSRRLAARVATASAARAWTASAAQASVVYSLVAGQEIYVEVLAKEGTGGDHLAVAWQRPDQAAIEVIPGRLPEGTVVLTSYTPDPLDADDDGLLDSWESSIGLNPLDNGSFNAADGGKADWDNDGLDNYAEWLSSGNPLVAGGNLGLVRRDIWTGISGSSVSLLTGNVKFPRPAQTSQWEAPATLSFATSGDNYGQRLRGCLVPPASGSWRFWIASDDASEFWLSQDASRLGKSKIAYVSSYTGVNAFDTTPSQASAPVVLSAGQPVYYEILHKEGTGFDHVSVAWQRVTPNWALASSGAVASQSSTYSVGVASRAIDGNTSGSWSQNSVTHTANVANSWWQVDFSQPRPVNRVVLWNRTDTAQNRLSNFRVSALDAYGTELASQTFFTTPGTYAGSSTTWDIGQSVQAQVIRVALLGQNNAGNGFLSLAELQAFEWTPESVRQLVPAAALQSAPDEPMDLDGDSLPDAWESQFGLSANDNGAINPAYGEYGDPDADGVPNFLEYKNQSSPVSANGAVGQLARETWDNLPGGSIYELVHAPAFLTPASARDSASAWQTSSRGDYYGQRLRGTLTAPQTGWYVFWIASDGESQLSLSSDSRKFAKEVVSSVGDGHYQFRNEYTGLREYYRFPSQRSKKIYLVAGESYFLEVLHKESIYSDYVSVAWSVNGASVVDVPFSALRAFTYDIDDLDDDDLPDSWESTTGLNPADNGSLDRGREGSLGDWDGDQLSNREEYLLGTDPCDADSDADGLDDFTEAHSLRSDPNDSQSGLGAVIASKSGAEGAALNGRGEWVGMPNGSLISLDRRGAAAWTFALTGSDYRLIEVLATPQGNTWAGAPMTIDIRLVRPSDGGSWHVGKFPIRDNDGQATRVLGMLPPVSAGTYRIEIAIDNLSETRNIRIDSVRVLAASGTDLNGNGIADWVDARLSDHNTVDFPESPFSLVSPVCLEGRATDATRSRLVLPGQMLTLNKSIDDRWFANVSLSNDGSAQIIEARFENDRLIRPISLAWKETNVLANGAITLRVGDALRLAAYPVATGPDSGTVSITGFGATIQTTGDAPVARVFNVPGVYVLQASHTANGQTSTGSLNVSVVAADFGATLAVRSGRWRDWTPTNLPEALPYESDKSLKVAEYAPINGKRKLRVATDAVQPVHVITRSEAGGSIAARGTVDPFLIGDMYDTGLIELLETLPDGTLRGRVAVIADRLPAGGYVEMQIWAGGAQFADGTNVKRLYAADFPANGVTYVDIYYPSESAISSFCHYTRLYTANGTLLSGY